jgi:hypothetical protein
MSCGFGNIAPRLEFQECPIDPSEQFRIAIERAGGYSLWSARGRAVHIVDRERPPDRNAIMRSRLLHTE